MAGHQTDILDEKTFNNQYFNTGASPAIKHDECILRNKEVCESDWHDQKILAYRITIIIFSALQCLIQGTLTEGEG